MVIQIVFYIGLVAVAAGLAGLVLCVSRAVAIKKGGGDEATNRKALNGLVALNMASVGTAALGLAMVTVGLIF